MWVHVRQANSFALRHGDAHPRMDTSNRPSAGRNGERDLVLQDLSKVGHLIALLHLRRRHLPGVHAIRRVRGGLGGGGVGPCALVDGGPGIR